MIAAVIEIAGGETCQFPTTSDHSGNHGGPPRYRSLKGEIGPAGCPGKRQDRLEWAQGKEKEDEDVPIAQFEVHPELAP